ncbi:hypothetical protein [Spirosoma endophyticum]|uniref:hypothetical protein n=1 Tax=Spirosoma endophyticum TaxID=662367 RepID=UPI001160AB4F|nr:hypothetical protein [Spirosoma endophyticum]
MTEPGGGVKVDKSPPAGKLKRSESAEPFPADQLGRIEPQKRSFHVGFLQDGRHRHQHLSAG